MRPDWQPVATRGNGLGLVCAVLGAVSFATGCHRLRPLCSTSAPYVGVRKGTPALGSSSWWNLRRASPAVADQPDPAGGGGGRSGPDFHSRGWRAGNVLASLLARAGIGPMQLLTTRGRRSGRPHTVPVVVVEQDEKRWLVAPYGPVSWVHNARVDGRVTLRRGRDSREFAVREVGAEEAGPVLKRCVGIATRTRACFEASKDSPVKDFVAEADRHPVFELAPLDTRTT
jgi:deazaflavin-dependent oxidoreductase (nitroreductase family)